MARLPFISQKTDAPIFFLYYPDSVPFIFHLHAFFISNTFFQLSISVAQLFDELSLKCCLKVVSAIFYQIFISHQMIALQKL